jgi:hypothetical protein
LGGVGPRYPMWHDWNPEQRAIAHILGTLDDKIELNRRMNETLEAMARALFKSWFVDFDPVRAKAEGRDPGLPQPLADLFPDSFEDSELGEIPRGWELVPHPRQWTWSSYRATVGETPAPRSLTSDWILGQFGQRVGPAQKKYRAFVAEGRGGPRPWEQLTGQIYLGSEEFVAQHQPNRVIRDIPRRQTQAQRPSLRVLFQSKGKPLKLIHTAYRRYGYRLAEIAAHLGVHAATVSRRLKQAERATV